MATAIDAINEKVKKESAFIQPLVTEIEKVIVGQKYLIDTNILIYYFAGSLNSTQKAYVDKILDNSFKISFITYIEFLGWKDHTAEGFKEAKNLLSSATILYADFNVVVKAVDLRKRYSIKLPDALIASTALIHDLSVVTRNDSDFLGIHGISVENPFKRIP